LICHWLEIRSPFWDSGNNACCEDICALLHMMTMREVHKDVGNVKNNRVELLNSA
jgi:hypothetical protein